MSSERYQLTIDLDAIAHNWAQLNRCTPRALCSAVVKANAYGLGATQVVSCLYRAGCRDFFVATLAEAAELRQSLAVRSRIYVLTGILPGEEQACLDLDVIPTLVSKEMLRRWVLVCSQASEQPSSFTSAFRAAIKVDSGMGRLGLSVQDVHELLSEPEVFARAGIGLVISHLACADTPEHPLNREQLARFQALAERVREHFPQMKFSLANSAGCMLGPDYHFDMVRCGISLYGAKQGAMRSLDIRRVATLHLSIIQLRELQSGESAGYGADFVASKDTVLAIAAGGYADGIFRYLSNRGYAYVGGTKVPIVGRVSMDSILLDVTGLGLEQADSTAWPKIELLGEHHSLDELASEASTVGYEMLTSLGQRFQRVYKDATVGVENTSGHSHNNSANTAADTGVEV